MSKKKNRDRVKNSLPDQAAASTRRDTAPTPPTWVKVFTIEVFSARTLILERDAVTRAQVTAAVSVKDGLSSVTLTRREVPILEESQIGREMIVKVVGHRLSIREGPVRRLHKTDPDLILHERRHHLPS